MKKQKVIKTKQNGLSDCAAFKMKAKIRTIHTINPYYEIGVRNKHSHWPFGNRSPPQEPINRPVNDHTGTKLQNHNQNLLYGLSNYCFHFKSRTVRQIKTKFQTINTTNPNYEIGVRSKHHH